MALDKKNIAVNFGGIDQKTDPKQVVLGKLLSLFNVMFTKTHEFIKRYGKTVFTKTSDLGTISTGLSIYGFNDETLIQDQSGVFYSYSGSETKWYSKGTAPNFDFTTESIVYTNNTIVYQDTAYDSVTGNQIFVYTAYSGSLGTSYSYYTIIEKATGNILVKEQNLAIFGASKVVVYNNTFMIFTLGTSGTYYYSTVNCATFASSIANVISTGCNALGLFDVTIIGSNIYTVVLKTASNNIDLYRFTAINVFSLRNSSSTGSANTSSVAVCGVSTTSIFCLYGVSTSIVSNYLGVCIFNDVASTSVLGTQSTSDSIYNITGYVDSLSGSCYLVWYSPTQLTAGTSHGIFLSNGTFYGSQFGMGGCKPISKLFYFNSKYYYFCSPIETKYINTSGITVSTTDQSSVFLVDFTYSLSVGFSYPVIQLKAEPGSVYMDSSSVFLNCLPEVVQYNDGTYNRFVFAYLKKSTSVSSLGAISYKSGVNYIDSFISLERTQRKILGKNLNFSGGQAYLYDGSGVYENNFNTYPYILGGPYLYYGAGAIGIGTNEAVSAVNKINMIAVYEWIDNQGQKHRSAESLPAVLLLPYKDNSWTTASAYSVTSTVGSLNHSTNIPYQVFTKNVFANISITLSGYPGSTTTTSIYPLYSGNDIYAGFTTSTGPTSTTTAEMTINLPLRSANTFTFTCTLNTDYIYACSTVLSVGQRIIITSGAGLVSGFTIIRAINSTTYQIDQIATASTVTVTAYTNDVFSLVTVVTNPAGTLKQNAYVTLYRTAVNGTVYYRCTDTVSLSYINKSQRYLAISSTMSDYELTAQDQLYTTGGEIENTSPPAPYIMITYKNRLLIVPKDNRLVFWYSKEIISGYPVEFTDSFIWQITELGGNITALAALDEKLIIFKNNQIFYMLGEGPAPNGTNNDFTSAQLISSDVGCTDKNSIVNTGDGLFFQSQKGIYLLNRSLLPEYIGAPVETYGTQEIISTQILLQQNQVRFSLVSGLVLCYDTFQKQWSVFQGTGDSLTEVDSEVISDLYCSINTDGVVKKETIGAYSDYRTVAGVQTQTYIPISFDTSWISLSSIEGYQRIYELILLGNYVTNHTMTVDVYYDFNESYHDTVTIADAIPSGAADVFEYRVFMPRQKCTSIRFKITEVPVATYFGEGLKISTMTLRVGAKEGLNKISQAKTYG